MALENFGHADMQAATTAHEMQLQHRHSPLPPSLSADPEGSPPPAYNSQTDPLGLAGRIKTPQELETIRANTSRKRDGCGPLSFNAKAAKAKKLGDFYEAQNEKINQLLTPVEEHVRVARETQGDNQLRYKIAVNGSFAANLVLAALQVYGAVSSVSLSLFTTMADALFDPLSNLTLILTHRAVNHVDPRTFPSGKSRLENVGNICFCFIMMCVSVVLVVVSIMQLVTRDSSELNEFHLSSTVAVCVAFATKLALFLYCWALRNQYSQIRILWEDHRNDLFINGFGILTNVLGTQLAWWIDPMGAILLSSLILFLWGSTMISEFKLLVGVSASTETLQFLTYISMHHSPLIKAIDTVRAYHSGPRLIAEIDIVVDPELSVETSHDVAEALQIKIESLPDFERAYVHIDFTGDHAIEHFVKKVL